MFGDQLAFSGSSIGNLGSSFSSSSSSSSLSNNRIAQLAAFAQHATFKIAENESPAPESRAYINYNYYNNVTHGEPGLSGSDLHRETLGLEQTIGDDRNASLGFRLPFLQLTGSNGVDDSQFGDIDLIFKYALYNDRNSGDVFSAGMVLTLPTESKDFAIPGQSSLNDVVFQPYIGYRFSSGDFFVQGFSSLAVPTDFRDVTFLFNDLAVGYFAYRDSGGTLRAVVPTAELHINTPLSHRGSDDLNPIGFPDIVDISVGAHAVFGRTIVGLAAVTPLTGPKPFDFEVIANFAVRW